MMRVPSVLVAAAVLLTPMSRAWAVDPDSCDPRSFAPAYFRILESCEPRAELPADSPLRSGLQALRYVPLMEDDRGVYATFGGEARIRWERLDPQRFGLAGGKPFTARGERLFLHADLHRDEWRVFVQLSAASEVHWPVARPADKSEPDVAQSFVDWEFNGKPTAGVPTERLRIGRFELPFTTNRLVGVNDPANLRRTFQGGMLDFGLGRIPVTAFATRPMINETGGFDDHWSRSERFSGIDATLFKQSSATSPIDSINAFVFDRLHNFAQFQNGSGAEHVQTWGTRVAAHLGGLRAAAQLTLQHGRLGGQRMDGNGFTLDVSDSLGGPWAPTLSASFGRASGDARSGDGRLDTFDPLYPNLSYSTDAGYFYPGNNEDISAAIGIQPAATFQLQVGTYVIRRLRSEDAAYQPPGLVLLPGTGSGGSRLASLPFFKAIAQLDRYDDLALSLVTLRPAQTLLQAHARLSRYAMAQWTFRF